LRDSIYHAVNIVKIGRSNQIESVHMLCLLYDRPIGQITHLACLSVCLSVCPSVPYGPVIRNKNCRKVKIGIYVPQGTGKWSAIFQLKRSKVKVTGCQKH